MRINVLYTQLLYQDLASKVLQRMPVFNKVSREMIKKEVWRIKNVSEKDLVRHFTNTFKIYSKLYYYNILLRNKGEYSLLH